MSNPVILCQVAKELRALADVVEAEARVDGPPWIDRVAEMPVNTNPDQVYMVQRGWKAWPLRGTLYPVTGLTIHHTMSHSPLATAQYCTRSVTERGKGYPTVQYHYWVSQDDGCPIYRLVPDHEMIWHDCTGAYQTTLSIGMAGSLHLAPPPLEQLESTMTLIRWLCNEYGIPKNEVQGHRDRYAATVCPGWDHAHWRTRFFSMLDITLGSHG